MAGRGPFDGGPPIGPAVLRPEIHADARGTTSEIANTDAFRTLGLPATWPHALVSYSKADTLRGLHWQMPAQGKLVRCVTGSIFDVAVDVRQDSATFGEARFATLTPADVAWIPPGFAHGFLALELSHVVYLCDRARSLDEHVLRWDAIPGILWPLPQCGYILSDRDRNAPALAEITPCLV